MSNKRKRLNKWALISSEPPTPPAKVSSRLCGVLDDGVKVLTSPVVYFSNILGEVRTLTGTIYILGQPAEQWEAKHPDWRERMHKAFGKIVDAA